MKNDIYIYYFACFIVYIVYIAVTPVIINKLRVNNHCLRFSAFFIVSY